MQHRHRSANHTFYPSLRLNILFIHLENHHMRHLQLGKVPDSCVLLYKRACIMKMPILSYQKEYPTDEIPFFHFLTLHTPHLFVRCVTLQISHNHLKPIAHRQHDTNRLYTPTTDTVLLGIHFLQYHTEFLDLSERAIHLP